MPASPRQTGLVSAQYSTLRGEWKCQHQVGKALAGGAGKTDSESIGVINRERGYSETQLCHGFMDIY
jgi:hypothetical protein